MRSIKSKLIAVFAILIILITLVIGSLAVGSAYDTMKQEVTKSVEMLAEEGVKLTQSRMETMISTLNIIALRQEMY